MTKEIKIIAKHFGKQAQTMKTIEELAEFMQELARDMVWNDRRKEIIEEMADVLLMIEQMKYFYSITDEMLKTEMEYKTKRTLSRYEIEVEDNNV